MKCTLAFMMNFGAKPPIFCYFSLFFAKFWITHPCLWKICRKRDPCLENLGPKTHPYGRHIPAPSTATVIHGSPGHVIDRSLYLRLVAKRPLLQAFLHPLVYELHASTELSAFVCSPMPTHDNLVIIYPCDAPQKCKEFIQVVM